MKNITLLVLCLLLIPVSMAQSKNPVSKSDDPPTLSDKQGREIAILERNLVQEQMQLQQLQQQYQTLSQKMQLDNAELQKKLSSAKVPGWTLDPFALTYKKNPESKKP